MQQLHNEGENEIRSENFEEICTLYQFVRFLSVGEILSF